MLGRQVPDVVLKTRVRDESIGGDNPFRWQDMRTGDLFRNKRVVVFSLPGAFTPTCTTEQCPAFERFYEDFKAAGVDEVYCVSVNDAFVMYQWGKHLGIKNVRSEEHTSELQSLMRISYAVFCLKKTNKTNKKKIRK